MAAAARMIATVASPLASAEYTTASVNNNVKKSVLKSSVFSVPEQD